MQTFPLPRSRHPRRHPALSRGLALALLALVPLRAEEHQATALAGTDHTLALPPGSPAPLDCQWSKNGVPIPGATNAILLLPQVAFLDEALYTCTATGLATPYTVRLSVTVDPASPDTDGDGLSDSFETYLACFGLDPAQNSAPEWQRLQTLGPALGTHFLASQMRTVVLPPGTLRANSAAELTLSLAPRERATSAPGHESPVALRSATTTPDGSLSLRIAAPAADTEFLQIVPGP
jgi:hypothetical protein